MSQLPRIIHLIPNLGIGGVERAAATTQNHCSPEFDFRVMTLSEGLVTSNSKVIQALLDLYRCFRKLLSLNPDVLIVSLWWCCVVGIFYKLFRRHVKLVTFVHLADHSHYVDLIATLLCSAISTGIWADSYASGNGRVPNRFRRKLKIISFIIEKIQPNPCFSVCPTFIFWGRLHRQKNLSRAIRFISELKSSMDVTNVRFLIIGPDQGELILLRNLCKTLHLEREVEFLGPKSFDEIRTLAHHASFYLQTSLQEGMGSSIVEAMQLGLVPILVPAGESAYYAIDGVNAVVIDCESSTLNCIKNLLRDEESYLRLRDNAIVTWQNAILYKDSINLACREILNCN